MTSINPALLALRGFIAAVLATLIFHQAAWTALHYLDLPGLGMPLPFPMTPTYPFGVPRIASLAFWAGIYGAVFALLTPRIHTPLWLAGIALGVVAGLTGGLIVSPLRGDPIAFGGSAYGLARSMLINGFWGLGFGLILPLLGRVPHPPGDDVTPGARIAGGRLA